MSKRLAVIVIAGVVILGAALLVPESAKENQAFSGLMYVAICFALIAVAYWFIASAVRSGVGSGGMDKTNAQGHQAAPGKKRPQG